jgi:hypothetical protein
VAVGDPLSLGIAPLGIKTSHLDIGVLSADTTGRNKMADGFLEYRHFPSVTGSRLLGNAAATGPVQEIGLGNGLGFVGGKLALTGGAGGALVPVIYDIQDGGSGDIPVPNEGAEIHHSHGLGRAPITAQVFLYPIIDDAGYRANAQPGIPDYVTAESFTTGIPNGDAVQAFSVWTSFDTIALCRPNVGTDPELTVPHRTGFGRVAITQSSWRVRLVIT